MWRNIPAHTYSHKYFDSIGCNFFLICQIELCYIYSLLLSKYTIFICTCARKTFSKIISKQTFDVILAKEYSYLMWNLFITRQREHIVQDFYRLLSLSLSAKSSLTYNAVKYNIKFWKEVLPSRQWKQIVQVEISETETIFICLFMRDN